MPEPVTLVRHTAIARRWRGRCYGTSDVGLSRAGAAAVHTLAANLAVQRPQWVVHSDLVRTRRLAAAVARLAACPLIADPRWRERDFSEWEGQSWNAIYRASGNAMDGMIDAPATFRPGISGETTSELADRAREAWDALPSGIGIVVTHGGPIAALLGQDEGLPPRDWIALVPAMGTSVTFMRDQAPVSACAPLRSVPTPWPS
jgi:broad specificity phosphatase PhoE